MTPRRAQKLMAQLHTDRLVLEPLLGSHAEHLFGMLTDPRVLRWVPPPKATTIAELRARWMDAESRCDEDGFEARLAWAIRLHEGGAYVGKLDANVADTRWATNVGYVLAADHWGCGYATEAVDRVVTHLFAAGIRGCLAYVLPGNEASARVLQRAGFEPGRMVLEDRQFTRQAAKVPTRA